MPTWSTEEHQGVRIVRVEGALLDPDEPRSLADELRAIGAAAPTVVDLTGLEGLRGRLVVELLSRLARAEGRPCPVIVHRDLEVRRRLRSLCPGVAFVPDVDAALSSHTALALHPGHQASA